MVKIKAQQWINEMFPSREEGELDLNEFKNLEDLAIWGNGTSTLQPTTNLKINQCSKLQKLYIDCTNLSELILRSNQEITSLTIEGCINLLKIEGMEELPKLQDLKIWNKNTQLKIPFNKDNWKQGLQELRRKKILSLEEKINKNEQQLRELADMVLPNITFDLGKLKQEIARLKLNELSPQARKQKSELERQINNIKTNIKSNSETIIDLLLETQEQIIGKNDPLVQAQFTGQLNAYLNILEKNSSKQELQALLNKKTELIQLEKQIDKLQTEIQQK
ncbi:hypothetical protein GLOIN_2v1474482 [Rhizophagus clarus]|uniref:Uncharacterized protein n=1 Tax=Rhizophagus clarus TaxID=94130 RepID=A0A8H3QNR5_9GLOM|nr:hypothetical protein GLOIN_2v1474482 [Rhizophagus clarus]